MILNYNCHYYMNLLCCIKNTFIGKGKNYRVMQREIITTVLFFFYFKAPELY